MSHWKKLVLPNISSVLEALDALEKTGSQFLVVTDSEGRALGTITDGDIRRALMKEITLKESCTKIMNESFVYLEQAKIEGTEKQWRQIKSLGIKFVPILDSNKKLIDIKTLDAMRRRRSNEALILAGGMGSRLGELTKKCPKPMLDVGGIPILETILLSLRSHGITKVNISVNYLSEMIEDYFGDGGRWDMNIHYIKEETRLGTAGPLSLLSRETFSKPLLVLNGDLVTKVDFGALLDFHESNDGPRDNVHSPSGGENSLRSCGD